MNAMRVEDVLEVLPHFPKTAQVVVKDPECGTVYAVDYLPTYDADRNEIVLEIVTTKREEHWLHD